MSEYLSGFILGLTQGLTEFLPVSSSGHLVLLEYLGVGKGSVALNLSLHLATLLAVLVVFRKDILFLLKHPTSKESLFLLLATLPTALLAGAVRYFVPQTATYLPTAFMATTVLLLLPSVFPKERTDYLGKGWQKRALFVGVMQGLACFNGVSRSGATVSAGYLVGLGEESGRTSFLLSIPIVVGSAAVEALSGGFSAISVGETAVGAVTAFLVGILAIKVFLKLIKNGKIYIFSIYTFLLSVGSFLLLYLPR